LTLLLPALSAEAATPTVAGVAACSSGGEWVAFSDGMVEAEGGAPSFGPAAPLTLNAPIVGIASAPDCGGYWLAASDGGVFTFGDASFYGSMGGKPLNKPVVGIAATSDGGGYWLAASDGGVFTFGDASFYGSMGSSGQDIAGLAMAATNGGYYLVTSSGHVLLFGNGASAVSQGSVVSSTTPTPSLPVSPGLFGGAWWDTPVVASRPVAADSSELVADFVNDYRSDYGSVGVNSGASGIPILTVPASQPMVGLAVQSGCNDYRASTGYQAPVPTNAPLNGTPDSPLVIYQPSSGSEWEFWQAHFSGGMLSACWGGRLSNLATSNGVFPSPYGLSGSGISYLATAITQSDIASGQIDHALALAMPTCSAPEVSPADRTDCSSDPGQPPEGTVYRLPTGLQMPPGLTPFAKMVFVALQRYGMVVVDQAGAVMLQAEYGPDWTYEGHSGSDPISASFAGQPEYWALNGMPWSQLQVASP
jgi:hypothetical protein